MWRQSQPKMTRWEAFYLPGHGGYTLLLCKIIYSEGLYWCKAHDLPKEECKG